MQGPSLSTTSPAVVIAVTLQKGDASVDSKQFDELVARLASGQSRRKALKGIAGGALATVGVTSVATAQGKKRVGAEECLAIGSRCPQRNHGKRHSCIPKPKKGRPGCCTAYAVRDETGKRRCACVSDNDPCTKNRNCCSQKCEGGFCVGYVPG